MLYELKKALLRPYSARVRRGLGDLDPISRAMLDLHYYRRPMLEFMAATYENPDILTDADLDADCVVLDVGAYLGEWTARVIDRYGATVHAFEPSPTELGEMHARLDDEPRAVLHGYGLAGTTRAATLALDGPGSSVHGGPATFGTAEVELRDVLRVLDDLGLDEVDLLKVNIEGGEYELFDRLIAAGALGRFRQVSIQFHEWLPDAYRRRAAIRRALSDSHWEVWSFPWVWELWTRR
jgi:FkbM family methyltransferase